MRALQGPAMVWYEIRTMQWGGDRSYPVYYVAAMHAKFGRTSRCIFSTMEFWTSKATHCPSSHHRHLLLVQCIQQSVVLRKMSSSHRLTLKQADAQDRAQRLAQGRKELTSRIRKQKKHEHLARKRQYAAAPPHGEKTPGFSGA